MVHGADNGGIEFLDERCNGFRFIRTGSAISPALLPGASPLSQPAGTWKAENESEG
jgi:hypothetical protein